MDYNSCHNVFQTSTTAPKRRALVQQDPCSASRCCGVVESRPPIPATAHSYAAASADTMSGPLDLYKMYVHTQEPGGPVLIISRTVRRCE